jgi:hypothetical protein
MTLHRPRTCSGRCTFSVRCELTEPGLGLVVRLVANYSFPAQLRRGPVGQAPIQAASDKAGRDSARPQNIYLPDVQYREPGWVAQAPRWRERQLARASLRSAHRPSVIRRGTDSRR